MISSRITAMMVSTVFVATIMYAAEPPNSNPFYDHDNPFYEGNMLFDKSQYNEAVKKFPRTI